MPTRIVIEVGNLKLKGQLSNAPTAKAIAKALPIEADFQTWGDEYHFRVPLKLKADDTSTREVEVGDIAYWPEGRALAIFYGPTPASSRDSDRPVPASEVNPVGKVTDDPTILRVVAGHGHIKIRKA